MMQPGLTGGHELFPNSDWEWEIRKSIPVKMTQFAAADAEFDSAEPVGHYRHAWPTRNGLLDRFAEGLSHDYRV